MEIHVKALLGSDFEINEYCYQIDTKKWTLPKVGVAYVVKGEKTFVTDAGTRHARVRASLWTAPTLPPCSLLRLRDQI